MPAKKKTRADRAAEAFRERYKVGKARLDLQETDIAEIVGFKTLNPLRKRRRDPLGFTVGQLMAMGAAFHWTADDYLAILQVEKPRASS